MRLLKEVVWKVVKWWVLSTLLGFNPSVLEQLLFWEFLLASKHITSLTEIMGTPLFFFKKKKYIYIYTHYFYYIFFFRKRKILCIFSSQRGPKGFRKSLMWDPFGSLLVRRRIWFAHKLEHSD